MLNSTLSTAAGRTDTFVLISSPANSVDSSRPSLFENRYSAPMPTPPPMSTLLVTPLSKLVSSLADDSTIAP
jgi:hypothetical protein